MHSAGVIFTICFFVFYFNVCIMHEFRKLLLPGGKIQLIICANSFASPPSLSQTECPSLDRGTHTFSCMETRCNEGEVEKANNCSLLWSWKVNKENEAKSERRAGWWWRCKEIKYLACFVVVCPVQSEEKLLRGWMECYDDPIHKPRAIIKTK